MHGPWKSLYGLAHGSRRQHRPSPRSGQLHHRKPAAKTPAPQAHAGRPTATKHTTLRRRLRRAVIIDGHAFQKSGSPEQGPSGDLRYSVAGCPCCSQSRSARPSSLMPLHGAKGGRRTTRGSPRQKPHSLRGRSIFPPSGVPRDECRAAPGAQPLTAQPEA